MPFNDPPSDTGRFVQALVDAPPGKTLLGTSEEMNFEDWAAIWGKVNGVKCTFHPVNKEELAGIVPPMLLEEMWGSMKYHSEYGYDGGDPEVLRPWDMGVQKSELMGVEEYIKKKDWSAVLNG